MIWAPQPTGDVLPRKKKALFRLEASFLPADAAITDFIDFDQGTLLRPKVCQFGPSIQVLVYHLQRSSVIFPYQTSPVLSISIVRSTCNHLGSKIIFFLCTLDYSLPLACSLTPIFCLFRLLSGHGTFTF